MSSDASSEWQPDRLLRALLVWTGLTFVLAWLPLIRGVFDGPSYEWATAFYGYAVRGAGVSGDYWVLVLETAIGGSILWFGWRGARMPFHALIVAWHALLFSDSVYSAVTNPERYRFRGDTLGIDVSLAWAGPLLLGAFLVLALLWVARDLRGRRRRSLPHWTRGNSVWLGSLVAMLPIQFVLLRFGPPHGTTDQIGVFVTIAQWMLLAVALRPRLHAQLNA